MDFSGLHIRWKQNAFGSIVWILLGLHTLHLVTDLGDTIVLAVLMSTRHGLTGGNPDVGRDLAKRYGCAGRHTIPGVPGAQGKVGPSLEGLAARVYIGGVVTNSPEALIRWIEDPKSIDAKTAMPVTGISRNKADGSLPISLVALIQQREVAHGSVADQEGTAIQGHKGAAELFRSSSEDWRRYALHATLGSAPSTALSDLPRSGGLCFPQGAIGRLRGSGHVDFNVCLLVLSRSRPPRPTRRNGDCSQPWFFRNSRAKSDASRRKLKLAIPSKVPEKSSGVALKI